MNFYTKHKFVFYALFFWPLGAINALSLAVLLFPFGSPPIMQASMLYVACLLFSIPVIMVMTKYNTIERKLLIIASHVTVTLPAIPLTPLFFAFYC